MVLVTRELIEAGRSSRGGFSRVQASLLGLPWPLPNGWISRVIGLKLPDERAEKFLALCDRHFAKVPELIGEILRRILKCRV